MDLYSLRRDPMKNKNVTLFVTSIFIILLIAACAYIPLQNRALDTISKRTQSQNITRPSFDYTVATISENEIVLEGEKGSMTLPKERVEVLRGDPSNAKAVSPDTLRPGDNVVVEFIPGERAWLYVL